jgi:hypothetical protein
MGFTPSGRFGGIGSTVLMPGSDDPIGAQSSCRRDDVSDLCITVAAYDDLTKAQTEWTLVEAAGDANSVYISDAAMLGRDPDGRVQNIHRQSHHG